MAQLEWRRGAEVLGACVTAAGIADDEADVPFGRERSARWACRDPTRPEGARAAPSAGAR